MKNGKLNILVKNNDIFMVSSLKHALCRSKTCKNLFLQEKVAENTLNLPLQTVNLYATVYESPRARNPFLLYAHAPGRHYPQFNFH